MYDAREMGLEAHLTCSPASMLIVGAAFKESMVGKQYDQADEQERASVRPFAEYALSSADSTRRGVMPGRPLCLVGLRASHSGLRAFKP